MSEADTNRGADATDDDWPGMAWTLRPGIPRWIERVGRDETPDCRAHSTWELVAHIDATQRLILARLRGESPPATEADFFPPVKDVNENAWKAAIARLKSQEEGFGAVVSGLSDAKLAAALPGGSTAYETLHGHVQHNAFHAGQIRLLRKALEA